MRGSARMVWQCVGGACLGAVLGMGCAEEFMPVIDASVPDANQTCPIEMVRITELGVCIDPYEASEGAGGVAASVAGAMPWLASEWAVADAACSAAGKRLCTDLEWLAACTGPPPGTEYPYGDTYDRDACNGGETAGAGLLPAGSMTGCEGAYPGLFDMCGNAKEWTATCFTGACQVRGGGHDTSDRRLSCALYTSGREESGGIGFRCCLTP